MPGTTPVNIICKVNEAGSMIHEEGIANTFARHEEMGRMVRDWAIQNEFSFHSPERECLSPTLTAICAPTRFRAETIRERLKQRGILTARGLGPYESAGIRIGHMGDIQPRDIQHTLDALSDVIAE